MLGKGQGSPTLLRVGDCGKSRQILLTPSQVIVYLRIEIESQTFRASPTPSRIEKFFLIAEEFLSSKVQSAKLWRVLLGHLALLMHLVPGGQLRMRALQLALKRGWNFVDDLVLVPWDAPSRDDLLWWCTEGRLEEGVSLVVLSPDHMFWSDASDQGWGTMVADQFASGLWLEGEDLFSVNHRELLAVERGLFQLERSERTCGSSVFRQHHSGGLSSSSGRNFFIHSQHSGSADFSLGGERGDLHLSTVCSGEEQCSGRCSLSSQPGGGDRVDSPSGGLRLSPQTLAGSNRSFCFLSKSPLWCVLCSSLGPHGCRDRHYAAVLGPFTGVCVSKKTLFLVALATAKRVGELQAVSRQVSFRGEDMYVSYLPHFVAKTDRPDLCPGLLKFVL